MRLTAKRLTALQAARLWAEFYHAHGAEVMARAYGWLAPDARRLRPGEKVWAFYDGVVRVGWGVMMLSANDPDDVEAVIALGIFPGHEGKGYRIALRDWMSAYARARGAEYAKLIVYKDNEAHYERAIRESKTGPWTYAGDVWYPEPGYGIFVRDLEPEGEPAALKEAA